jgi:hypothetical protein
VATGAGRFPLRIVLAIVTLAGLLALSPSATAVACTGTAPGLLARWPGDGTTADVAHGRDGTLAGGATFGAGEVGQAFSLDGVGDTVTVPDAPDWTLDGDFTIDTWANFDTVPSSGHVVLVGHDEGSGSFLKWLFWWKDTGQLSFHMNTGATTVDPVSYTWTPTTGTWYHLAVTRSGSLFTLYVDGASVATGSDSTVIGNSAGPITLGSAENDYYLDGRLDEPEIYGRALSDGEIGAIHDAGGNARCAMTRSTLSLDGPATAFPDATVTLTGTLGLSGGASVDAKTISITRSIDGGAPVGLPDATTALDGTFSFQDAPGAGTVTYRATFAGATDISAENAWATVVLAKKKAAVTIELSTKSVRFHDAITVTAHLAGGASNRIVTIWAVPAGGSKQRIAQAKVDRHGNLAVKHKPSRKTTFYAAYAGDARWTGDTSSDKVVTVTPRWSIAIIGGYATVHGVRQYHYSAKCSPSNSAGCPAATFTLSPNHAGDKVSFQGKYCHNGKCLNDNRTFRLNAKSKAPIFIFYGDQRVIGWNLNFRLRFPGDADHLSVRSAWVKTKVTS